MAGSDSIPTNSVAISSLHCDSVAPDSLQAFAEPHWGITLQAPHALPSPGHISDNGSSLIILLLLIPFIVVAVKLKSSSRFVASLWHDLTSVRERSSLFDNTVRETSLLFFLVILTVLAGGILLAASVPANNAVSLLNFPLFNSLPSHLNRPVLCILLMGGYMLFSWCAYNIVGRVFETPNHTRLWVRGFAASMSLLGLIWLPCALICISRPEWTPILAIIAGVSFILAKITFIWKGFRIFFSKGASWMLFLYYLCSLEMVPVILLVAIAGSLA